MMNINNTDHFLLASREDSSKRKATTFELASIAVAVFAVIGAAGLLI